MLDQRCRAVGGRSSGVVWGAAVYFAETSGPLVRETSPVSHVLAWCYYRSWAKNEQQVYYPARWPLS